MKWYTIKDPRCKFAESKGEYFGKIDGKTYKLIGNKFVELQQADRLMKNPSGKSSTCKSLSSRSANTGTTRSGIPTFGRMIDLAN